MRVYVAVGEQTSSPGNEVIVGTSEVRSVVTLMLGMIGMQESSQPHSSSSTSSVQPLTTVDVGCAKEASDQPVGQAVIKGQAQSGSIGGIDIVVVVVGEEQSATPTLAALAFLRAAGVGVAHVGHAWLQLEGPTTTSRVQPSRSVVVGKGPVVSVAPPVHTPIEPQAHVRGVESVESEVTVVVAEHFLSPPKLVTSGAARVLSI